MKNCTLSHYPGFFGIASDGDLRKCTIYGKSWVRMAFVQWITMVRDNNRIAVEPLPCIHELVEIRRFLVV